MSANIESFSYLWDGSEAGWKLTQEADFPGEICIINYESGLLLHVDDPELKKSLCAKMLENGVPIEDDALSVNRDG